MIESENAAPQAGAEVAPVAEPREVAEGEGEEAVDIAWKAAEMTKVRQEAELLHAQVNAAAAEVDAEPVTISWKADEVTKVRQEIEEIHGQVQKAVSQGSDAPVSMAWKAAEMTKVRQGIEEIHGQVQEAVAQGSDAPVSIAWKAAEMSKVRQGIEEIHAQLIRDFPPSVSGPELAARAWVEPGKKDNYLDGRMPLDRAHEVLRAVAAKGVHRTVPNSSVPGLRVASPPRDCDPHPLRERSDPLGRARYPWDQRSSSASSLASSVWEVDTRHHARSERKRHAGGGRSCSRASVRPDAAGLSKSDASGDSLRRAARLLAQRAR